MRILFAGSPSFAVPSLIALAEAHAVCGVLTGPDRAVGRGRRVESTPVKQAASSLGLRVFEAEAVTADLCDRTEELRPDILVVVAFGLIFRRRFLSLFPAGGINVHPSLLPRHRGASPIPATILEGDPETGVTVQRLASRFDSGDILAQDRVAMAGTETAGSLGELLAARGSALLVAAVASIERGTAVGTPQVEEDATYCSTLRKDDGLIDWRLDARKIERAVRAYDPWPLVYTEFRHQRLQILKSGVVTEPLPAMEHPAPSAAPDIRTAAIDSPGTVLGTDARYGILVRAGEGILGVQRLRMQYRNPCDWRPFVNGCRDIIGARLGGGG